MPCPILPRTIAIGAVAFLLTGPTPPASAADAPSAGKSVYQSTLRSTVWIVVPQEVARRPGIVAYAFASGSGSLIDVPNRLILTNYHVVRESATARIMFPVFSKGKLVQEREYYEKRLDTA